MGENKGFFKGIIILLLIIIILLLGVVIMFLVKDYKGQEDTKTENKPLQENVYIENGYENASTSENILLENGAGEVVENETVPENTNTTENVTNENTTNTNNPETKIISRDQAIEIVCNDLKIKREDMLDLDAERDYKYGQNVYEIDFKYDRLEYEYYISENTGSIVHSFKERD